ncbi:hypothetical protein CEUSTIGMA_g9227.t1 [Chlamydomonas eustigma]|uniref:Uncharacterized protein n=1 Tax=Chlamydomonas eustigma TaxID=1157962 RepID=A0A250XFW5_9CHLO|nr:hypothetical protein CEUSTIGMA_g9227.t1 [Chlamydomonas eustigma]|eukprot:GAX81799.1 hypothetical protein CEUSTIGMA_g9227.t1 [Chlamydomonas eustigma]
MMKRAVFRNNCYKFEENPEDCCLLRQSSRASSASDTSLILTSSLKRIVDPILNGKSTAAGSSAPTGYEVHTATILEKNTDDYSLDPNSTTNSHNGLRQPAMTAKQLGSEEEGADESLQLNSMVSSAPDVESIQGSTLSGPMSSSAGKPVATGGPQCLDSTSQINSTNYISSASEIQEEFEISGRSESCTASPQVLKELSAHESPTGVPAGINIQVDQHSSHYNQETAVEDVQIPSSPSEWQQDPEFCSLDAFTFLASAYGTSSTEEDYFIHQAAVAQVTAENNNLLLRGNDDLLASLSTTGGNIQASNTPERLLSPAEASDMLSMEGTWNAESEENTSFEFYSEQAMDAGPLHAMHSLSLLKTSWVEAQPTSVQDQVETQPSSLLNQVTEYSVADAVAKCAHQEAAVVAGNSIMLDHKKKQRQKENIDSNSSKPNLQESSHYAGCAQLSPGLILGEDELVPDSFQDFVCSSLFLDDERMMSDGLQSLDG